MKKITQFSSRTIVVSILVVAILLIAATAVYGALYWISVDDNSISDWSGIPVFQTDAVGDASPPDEDIVNAWVASGYDDALYFLVEMNGSPAISAGGLKAIAASIDCDNNGVDREPHDRISVYTPGSDIRKTCTGDGDQCTLGDTDGQVVGRYLEWLVNWNDLPPDSENPDVDCQNNIQIRFAVIDSSTSPVTIFDETAPLKGWDLPNAVNLLALEARTDSGLLVLVVTAALLLLSVTLILFRIRRSA